MTEKSASLSWAQVCAFLRFRHLQFLDILGCVRNLRLTGLMVPAGTVETPFFSVFELLQATHMLSLQPQAIVEKYVRKGLLGRVPAPILGAMPDYGLIARKGEVPSEAMREFIGILHRVAGRA